jgi:neutral ceramidase
MSVEPQAFTKLSPVTRRSTTGELRGVGLLIALSLTLSACGGESVAPLVANTQPQNQIQSSEAQSDFTALFATSENNDTTALTCAANDPRLAIGAGRDAASTPTLSTSSSNDAANSPNAGSCTGNESFKLGSAIIDITGPAAGSVMMGYESPTHVSSGIQTRQYARAYVIDSPCNNKRVAFVSADIGMIFHSVRQGVLEKIQADPTLKNLYGEQNIMISATHTHAGPGGYSHHAAFNAFRAGYDDLAYQGIVEGIAAAIKNAHMNMANHAVPGKLRLGADEVLNANINRSKPAYAMNVETERKQFLNILGQEQDVEKSMTLLRLDRGDGRSIGLINWFGVHPTTTGNTNALISSDNKGWAAMQFEKIAKTNYAIAPGQDNFVASFAQTNEGDSSPNIFILDKPFAERGGSQNEFESVAINGSKQLNTALRLFKAGGKAVKGGVGYAQFHVAMDKVSVTDPVVLGGLKHPAGMDTAQKRTCTAGMGVSFGAGAEDGPGPTVEGVSCADPAGAELAARDFAAAQNGKVPPHLLAKGALCNLSKVPASEIDLSCHAEKPVLFVLGPPFNLANNILPLQIFTIGNLALVALPWEVTTMAGRRIRDTVQNVLKDSGVDTVVIAGLSNDYVSYLTTREEYSLQHYEGASTQFGPWTLAAVQQELRKLAISLKNGAAPPAGPTRVVTSNPIPRPPYIGADFTNGPTFGTALSQAPASKGGDTVTVSFQSAHPRNQTERGRGFALIERLSEKGVWETVKQDGDGEIIFRWKPQSAEFYASPVPLSGGVSTADLTWFIPKNVISGKYRIKHQGVAVSNGSRQSFSGVSNEFRVQGETGKCAY